MRLVPSAGEMGAAQFMWELIDAIPSQIHTGLTDNSVWRPSRNKDIWDTKHIFGRVCRPRGIEHRLNKVNHP